MKKPNNSTSFFSLLTDDLLLKILTKLIESYDIKTWRLVCKDFLKIETQQRKALKVFRHESLPSLLRKYNSLHLLDLSACPKFDYRTVSIIFIEPSWAKRIRTLVLNRANSLKWAGFEIIIRSCPSLESIDVSYCCGFGDREASAISSANGLRDLKLVKCLGVTDVGLAKIAVGCERLERLSLKWCLQITDLGIDLLTKKCSDLKKLDISYLKVTNKSLDSISSLRKLEDLSMVRCSFINDDGLHFLNGGNGSLQSMDVSRCDKVSTSGIMSVIKRHEGLARINAGHCHPECALSFLLKLNDLKSLQSLRLDGFRVSVTMLGIIGLKCKNLAEIGLSKCSGVTDEGISSLASSNLRILDLTCCHMLTDAALLAIANSCKKLVCLKLESCSVITEEGLDRLGTCCSSLQELDLTDCGLNDTGLKCLSKCSELKDLKLGLCQYISDKGLSHIGSNCNKIQELDLYRCTGIGDDGLAVIAKGCRKLKKLNMCYCIRITDEGLKHLSTLRELSDLELRRLVNITSNGLTALAIGCKSLVQLDMKRCYSIDDMGLWALSQYARNLRQINISYCPVSDVGLRVLLGNLKCLQDAKLVHLTRVSLEGLELALRACCDRLKKVKLASSLKYLLSLELVQMLQARGCLLRWIEKPLVLV